MRALLVLALLMGAGPAFAGVYYDDNGVMHDDADHSYYDEGSGTWKTDPDYAKQCGCHYETDENGQLHLVIDTEFGSDPNAGAGESQQGSGMQQERGHGSGDGGRGPDSKH